MLRSLPTRFWKVGAILLSKAFSSVSYFASYTLIGIAHHFLPLRMPHGLKCADSAFDDLRLDVVQCS